MLCQIELCWSYAEKHGRNLLVDTRRTEFLDDFAKYFLPREEGRVSLGDFDASRWNGDVRPGFLAGRVNDYTATWSGKRNSFVERESKKPVTFDFSRKHNERVLVHEQCGGGERSILALQRLRLASTAADIVVPRLRRFGDYSAVHVRNTDFQTDYVPLLQHVAASVPRGLVVLCTDDWRCQAFARHVFGDRVRMSSDIPETGGRPLHGNRGLNRYRTNLDAITDLFVLAMGKRLFVSKHASGRISGYSRLAQALSERLAMLPDLLGREI